MVHDCQVLFGILSARKHPSPRGLVRIFWLGLLFALCLLPLEAEKLTLKAKQVSRETAKGREKTTLEGEVVLGTNKFRIEAGRVTITGRNERYIEAESKVFIRDQEKDMTLQGEYLFYDRETDILLLKGNCMLQDYDNELVLMGGILEHRNADKITKVQLGVRILKKDITARAELLYYFQDNKEARLSGLPVVYRKNDEYRAREIVINLDTEEITVSGQVSGTLQTESEDSGSTSPVTPEQDPAKVAPPEPTVDKGLPVDGQTLPDKEDNLGQ